MEPLELAHTMGVTFDALGVKWVLGGSLASSLSGEPRATMDIDMAVRMTLAQALELVDVVRNDFYVNEHMVIDAVARHASFNLIPNTSPYKVDVFALGDGMLDRRQIDRRRRVIVAGPPSYELWVGSPEDQILRKLTWYRLGQEVSDRQWRDIVGILRVQSSFLDLADLRSTADAVGLRDLLERAIGLVPGLT